jgi:3-carboxy-cis,cis-muconate cycloisomerase
VIASSFGAEAFVMQEQPTALRIPDPGIRALFTEAARLQSWLDVEAALAEAEAELGVIPPEAAAEISRKAQLALMDMDQIRAGLRRTGHQLVPLVWELARVCEGDAGGYVHWGATTPNITQTGQLMRVRQAHRILLRLLAEILTTFADLGERSQDMLLPGRTHGQHALPITFGFKVAVWIDELCRHAERLQSCEARVFVAMLGGGVGSLASLGEIGLEVQARMAAKLDMQPMSLPARTIADREAEYVTLLGMLASTCSKVAREIYTLMKQEFGEVEEPVPEGTVGSSTMPQKRNPKLCEDILAAGAEVRAYVPLALEAMQAEHEADTFTTAMMTRALSESCCLVGDILQRLLVLADGLQLFPDRMRQNLDLSGGLIMAEPLMLELAKQIGRQHAHDVIYDASQSAAVSGRAFRELLAEDQRVSGRITAEQIDTLLDPARYTGLCQTFAEQGAVQARAVAGRLNS